jgi:hypothetical protein
MKARRIKMVKKSESAKRKRKKVRIRTFPSPHSGNPVSEHKAARQGESKGLELDVQFTRYPMLKRQRGKHTGEETQAVKSCLGNSILPILFCLSSSACPVIPVLFCLSCSAYPVLPIPLCLSYSACPVQPVMFCLSCSAGPILPVLFSLSYFACPILPVCPVLPVPFCLPW